MVEAAEGQTSRPLRHLQHANLFSGAVIDIDLSAGDVDVARFVGQHRRAPSFREYYGRERSILQLRRIGSSVVLADHIMVVAWRKAEDGKLRALQHGTPGPARHDRRVCARRVEVAAMLIRDRAKNRSVAAAPIDITAMLEHV